MSKLFSASRTLKRIIRLKDKLATETGGMLVAGAAERNKQAILDVLSKYLPSGDSPGLVLEIASGPGQHMAHFASHFQNVKWQPSDLDQTYLQSISAYIDHKGLTNVYQPIQVDICKPVEQWANEHLKPQSLDLMLNINMVHISPWETSLGLFKAAGSLLKPNGVLFMYGPFKVNGELTPESNVRFDANLRSQDSRWGVRDVNDLEKLGKENGLKFEKMVDMPANNKCSIFRKTA